MPLQPSMRLRILTQQLRRSDESRRPRCLRRRSCRARRPARSDSAGRRHGCARARVLGQPVDNSIAAGMLREMVDHDFPVVLGRHYAATVEAIGPDLEGYAVGDEVFGFLLHANPTVHEGSWAELIALTPEMQVAPKPASLDLAAAGVAPLAAFDALALSEGETVLIVGATGGVGSFAVQLAARAGATIIAPALPEDGEYLRDLGVTERLDRDGDLVA